MQLPSLLETAIGLVLLFTLTSILVSAAVESIAGWRHRRAKNLFGAVRRMLGEDRTHALFRSHLVKSLSQPGRRNPDRPAHGHGPSYIPADIFSWVITDWLFHDGDFAAGKADASYERKLERFPESARRMLRHFIEQSADLARFRAQLESWFDAVMDRAAGWYARRTRVGTVLIGFVVAAAMNIDTIAVSSALISDSTLRTQLVTFVDSLEDEGIAQMMDGQDESVVAPTRDQVAAARELLQDITDTMPVIGWSRAVILAVNGRFGDSSRDRALSWGLKGIGWLITAIGASLGASFWFDRLAILMRVRMAGKNDAQQRARGVPDRPNDRRKPLKA